MITDEPILTAYGAMRRDKSVESASAAFIVGADSKLSNSMIRVVCFILNSLVEKICLFS